MGDIEHKVEGCPACGKLGNPGASKYCRGPMRARHAPERWEWVEVVRADAYRGAVRECELLREWIDAFGRETCSISVDDVLTASRRRIPPPTGGR